MMARLCLGHSRLRAHLHRIKMVDSPNCLHCQVPETVEHFLLHCFRHHRARCILRQYLLGLGVRNMDVATLLGGGNFDMNVKEKVAKALIRFLLNTGKLNDI